MMNDPLANMLIAVKNATVIGKDEVIIKPVSNISTKVLSILKENNYVKDFEMIEDGKGGIYRIVTSRRLNECGAVKPRFPVKGDDFLKWERRFLPAQGFGIIIISTSKGVMTLKQAKKKGVGGKLIAYAY